jgi:5-methylcytosine-specific restriction endonuclease McrA
MAIDNLFNLAAASKPRRQPRVVLECSECGAETKRNAWEVRTMRESIEKGFKKKHDFAGKAFCSSKCYRTFQSRSRVTFQCSKCSKDVSRPRSQAVSSQLFCSEDCRDSNGLTVASCSWPCCNNMMPARRRYGRGPKSLWKVDLTRSGDYLRNPLCGIHTAYVQEHMPEGHRVLNGSPKWFSGPGIDLGTRGVSSRLTRLLVWSKHGGCCAKCAKAVPFRSDRSEWNCDHIVPFFKGGKTNYYNLEALCRDCHDIKSSGEKSEAALQRHREHKSRRWLTHPQKDALIASLRDEIKRLGVALRAKEHT